MYTATARSLALLSPPAAIAITGKSARSISSIAAFWYATFSTKKSENGFATAIAFVVSIVSWNERRTLMAFGFTYIFGIPSLTKEVPDTIAVDRKSTRL